MSKKICLDVLGNILNVFQMKLVKGGSGTGDGLCYCDGECQWVRCKSSSDCGTKICPDKGSVCM